jgi:hypothetical protein
VAIRHHGHIIAALAEKVSDGQIAETIGDEDIPEKWFGYSLIITRERAVVSGGTCIGDTKEDAIRGAETAAKEKIDEALRLVGKLT